MLQWASYIKAEIGRIPNTEPSSYYWAMACAPSAYAIRKILSKTRILLGKWADRPSASIALLDGRVIRTDGHINTPRRIMGAGTYQCIIAYVGCGGFLLKEADLVASESCDSYFRWMESILIARMGRGIGPSDVICDNPSVIFGKLGAFFRGIWGEISRRGESSQETLFVGR